MKKGRESRESGNTVREEKMKEEEGGGDGVKRAEKWLLDMSRGLGQKLEALALHGLEITLLRKGFLRCTFLIPHNLSDKDGNWDVGAIAILIDDVAAGAAASISFIKASLDFHVSYYSTAKIHEEVEVEAEVVGEKGRLKSVVVEIKKKKNKGELVAVGRAWFTTDNIDRYRQSATTSNSKL